MELVNTVVRMCSGFSIGFTIGQLLRGNTESAMWFLLLGVVLAQIDIIILKAKKQDRIL